MARNRVVAHQAVDTDNAKLSGSFVDDGTSLIVPVPRYRKIFNTMIRNSSFWYISVVILLLTGYFVGREIQKTTGGASAGVNTATISVQPGTSSIPSAKSYQVWVTASNPVAFIQTDISFNTKMLKLTQEPTLNANVFDRVIKKRRLQRQIPRGLSVWRSH